MRYFVRVDVVEQAHRFELEGVAFVTFLVEGRPRTMLAEYFDMLYGPETDDEGNPVDVHAAPLKRRGRPAGKKAASEDDLYFDPLSRTLGKPKTDKSDGKAQPEPSLNDQIVAALKVAPMDLAQLKEKFHIGENPKTRTAESAAFYARMKALEAKKLVVAPPKFSGGAWKAA